jgi:hypothetical protein
MTTPRIEALKRKLKAREGKKEFEKNCEEIRAEIARLETGIAKGVALDEFLSENEKD